MKQTIRYYGLSIIIAVAITALTLVLTIKYTKAYFKVELTSDGGPDFIGSVTEANESDYEVTAIRGIDVSDRRPGYKDVMILKVEGAVNFDLKMTSTSNIPTGVEYTVYTTNTLVNASNSCSDVDNAGNSEYSENCTIINLSSLGSSIGNGTITSSVSVIH